MSTATDLAINSIVIGERRREDDGDIAGLAASLKRFGLFHPVVVDDQGNLVAGGRRLEAARQLGWETIPVRHLGELTEAERREIELEENLRRKDLTPYERDKALVQLVAVAQQAAQQESELRAESARNSRGRPPMPGSLRDVAERIGRPVKTIHDATQRVAAAEKYPELQSPDITQRDAVKAAKVLDALPDTEREARRAALREQAESDHSKMRAVFEAASDPEGRIERASLKAAYSTGIAKAGALFRLRPESIVGLLDEGDCMMARFFLRDTRAWLDRFEAALGRGIRLVEDEHAESR